MINLTVRNLRVFFRQRAAVLFSLLGVFIIIALYVLFLGDVWTDSLGGIPGAENLMNSWVIAGIVSVTSITTTMGAAGTIVDDRVRKCSKDFYAAPLKRHEIVGGYVLAIFAVGMIMSLVALAAGQAYILLAGGELLSVSAIFRIAAVMVVSVFSSSSLVFFIVSFMRTTGAFTSASTVIGSLIGFLTGIYLPIGSLPQGVQWLIKLFPVSHASVLMRQIMMQQPIADSFAGVPADTELWFKEYVGVTYSFGSHTLEPLTHMLILSGVAVLFFGLALLNISKKES